MKHIKAFYQHFYNDSISLRGQMFNISMMLCTIVGVVGVIANIAQGAALVSSLTSLIIPIGTIVLLLLCHKTKNYRVGSFIVGIVLCFIFIPILFFLSGGIHSGMIVYMILGAVVLFLLMGDKTIDWVIMIALYLVINGGCIVISYFYPSLLTPISTNKLLYFDVFIAFIITSLLITVILSFQIKIFKKEQKRANEALKAKDEFLANMSHEIRTPLNAVIGVSEIQMRQKGTLPPDTLDDIKKIHSSGKILLQIINDILDIAKIGSGNFKILNSDYQVASMLNDTIQMNKVRIGDKDIEFCVEINSKVPAILYGDELRIRQILNNLLSNAFKYTIAGTVTLEITCEELKGTSEPNVWMQYSVKDTGFGIKEDDLARLFGKYEKVEDVKLKKIEGTGLGLAITQDLIKMMGGNISVSSEYGKGSAFTVRLPQKIVDSTPIGEEVANAISSFEYRDEEKVANDIHYKSFKGKRALVVDDIDINLYITKELLLPYDIEVDCVESGIEAIEIIRRGNVKYDIIFMDHMMPEMNGIDATTIIREDIDTDYAKEVSIIALTANAVVGNREMFLSNGFQEFLSKPIDPRKLNEVVMQWLKD